MSNISNWQPGDDPPAGYTVETYTHCESCQGHQYLAPIEELTISKAKPRQLFNRQGVKPDVRPFRAKFD